MISEADVYQRLGEDGFAQLVAAFYRRVREDAAAGGVVGRLYPEGDWEGAEKRLRDFLVYRFGGPARYIAERGHPRLRMRHMPFVIGVEARDRWLEMMGGAMEETAVDGEVRAVLGEFFGKVAEMMRNS